MFTFLMIVNYNLTCTGQTGFISEFTGLPQPCNSEWSLRNVKSSLEQKEYIVFSETRKNLVLPMKIFKIAIFKA